MSIANLHSVLNDRWFIDKSYGQSLFPSLYAILKGGDLSVSADNKKPENFIFVKGAQPVAAIAGSGSSNTDFVLVMNLKNPIYKYDQDCGPSGTKSKMATLDYYANNPNCIGVVLDIDSGGGQVSGTPEFYDYLLNYAKPIVSYTDGMMCSAAYYIGSATSHIVANKRAEHIGSIGTMISFIDWTGYIEKEGGKVITEYATLSTEKNRPFEELLKGNGEVYVKEVLDPINVQFHDDVKATREGISEDVFAGGTWNATDALERKLIDSIGTLQSAIDKVFELSNSKTSINTNLNDMSKNLPRVEAVLGLEAPLAVTENGSYLNQEQLDTVEASLETLETENISLQSQLTDAQSAQTTAVEAVTNQLTEATATATATETTVDAMLTNAGLPVTGTFAEKTAALSTWVEAKGKTDGAGATIIKIDANETSASTTIVGGIDVTAALNN